MLLMPFGIVSLVAAGVVWGIRAVKGGADAAVAVSGVVLTGRTLNIIAVLLAVAGVLFVAGAVIKAVRRIAAIAAMVALVAGGGVGALVPKSVSDFVDKHCGPGQNPMVLRECYDKHADG